MTIETDQISPELYQKLVTLSELIIERNNIIEILGVIQQKKIALNEKLSDILIHKFNSKITLIDKQASRTAEGLSCSVCHDKLGLTDDVLACEWCGSPAHKDHLLHHVKTEGYCPACGESLKYHYRGAVKTVTHDLFKTCVIATMKKIHQLQVFYEDKLIETAESGEKPQCPECHREVLKDWHFCRFCGARLEPSKKQEEKMITCSQCGRQIKSSWKYCKLCGAPQSLNSTN